MSYDLSVEALAATPEMHLIALLHRVDGPEDLARIAQALPASAYDPSLKAFASILSKSQQETLTAALLRRLELGVPAEIEAQILDDIRTAIDGYWTGFDFFCTVIGNHAATLQLDRLVQPLLRRAIFCSSLLQDFVSEHRHPPEAWLNEIRRRRASLDFVELAPDLRDALPDLDKALAAFRPD